MSEPDILRIAVRVVRHFGPVTVSWDSDTLGGVQISSAVAGRALTTDELKELTLCLLGVQYPQET